MTRRVQSFTIVALAAACLTLSGGRLPAQEKISPVSDFQYKKDYAEYEAIKKEADPQKRGQALMDYVKRRPISRILLYATSDYLETLKPQMDAKNWSKVIEQEEAFLALLPTEQSVKSEGVPEPGATEFITTQLQPAHKTLLQALMAAHYQANNLPKAAEIAEKLYAQTPDKATAATLADLYLKMQNLDKYLEYGEKVLAEFPIEQSYGTALQMAGIHLQKNNVPKARELYGKVIDAFGDKTPPGLEEAMWNAIRATAVTFSAAEAYSQKDYPKAIELYEKVAKFDSKRDDAYYYIGMSKWNNKDPEGAIDAFAKATVLGKANAAKAKQYLEDLYKARHNNSLDGLDQVMAKAKADLGIS
jgi:tetratricopeptide (TPR) repeat protein